MSDSSRELVLCWLIWSCRVCVVKLYIAWRVFDHNRRILYTLVSLYFMQILSLVTPKGWWRGPAQNEIVTAKFSFFLWVFWAYILIVKINWLQISYHMECDCYKTTMPFLSFNKYIAHIRQNKLYNINTSL